MDIQSDIAAVQSRIQEIAQGTGAPSPVPAAGAADGFAAALARALGPQAAVDAMPGVSTPIAGFNPGLLAQRIPGMPTSVAGTGSFVWPATGPVTSPFGPRANPFGGGSDFHPGMDIAAQEGSPIRAASGGRVVAAGPDGGYGNVVVIDHGNGVTSKYAHCSQTFATAGQLVQAGDEIAAVGSTGHSTGPHLHFEVRVGDKPVDPAPYLK